MTVLVPIRDPQRLLPMNWSAPTKRNSACMGVGRTLPPARRARGPFSGSESIPEGVIPCLLLTTTSRKWFSGAQVHRDCRGLRGFYCNGLRNFWPTRNQFLAHLRRSLVRTRCWLPASGPWDGLAARTVFCGVLLILRWISELDRGVPGRGSGLSVKLAAAAHSICLVDEFSPPRKPSRTGRQAQAGGSSLWTAGVFCE